MDQASKPAEVAALDDITPTERTILGTIVLFMWGIFGAQIATCITLACRGFWVAAVLLALGALAVFSRCVEAHRDVFRAGP